MQGNVGEQGRAGGVVVGARGSTGAAGPPGDRGEAGLAGLQGSSYAGAAGPAGPRGPAGEQGLAGDRGPEGTTLVGPAGQTGRTGAEGVQGQSGQTGDRGVFVAGIAGEAGPSGLQGGRGREGQTGEQGPAGIVALWTSYRDFDFDRTETSLRASEMDKIADIAAYLIQNPSLEVGIDGSLGERSSRNNRDLSSRRAASVRDALMQAGVPANKIETGAFADPERRHEGQIQVLIKTRA